MKPKPRRCADPIERQMELALNPGAFIPDRAAYSFVSDLEGVAVMIGKLTRAEPNRAAALYETFLAGCYEKVEELHDSSGSFGLFVDGLICGWIKARQASGASADETAAQLLARMDNDPFALCYDIAKEAAKAFNKAGLAAFERQIATRFEAVATTKRSPGHEAEYLRRRWSDVLRTIYHAQRNFSAYSSLATETGLTTKDCHALATMLVARRKPEEALAWAERGLALDKENPHGCTMAGFELIGLHRELLTRLGRGNEAIEAAWADFQEAPGKYSYDELMKFVPKNGRAAWHKKAMDAAMSTAMGDDLGSVMELFIETKEMQRLVELVRGATDAALEKVSHNFTEPAAKKLEKAYPDLAARLWRAQGVRIVNAAKSKYYDAALSNFERARRCYERAGLAAEWADTVSHMRARHRRKTGFMSGFEALAAGAVQGGQPSFLERARTRWGVGKEHL